MIALNSRKRLFSWFGTQGLRLAWLGLAYGSCLAVAGDCRGGMCLQDPGPAEAGQAADVVVENLGSLAPGFAGAFDRADIAGLLDQFAPQCELIDEQGAIYAGREEIRELLASFFERYPGARLTVNVETIRQLGDSLAIEEGTRSIAVGDEVIAATSLRYLAVFTRINGEWKIASIRDFPENVPAVPADFLRPLAWLVGDWVNEGSDSRADIHFRWSEDGNYLLGEYTVETAGEAARKTSQRIGWDPQRRQIRSWTFDSDGGFSEGFWATAGDGWVIKSTAVLPDGSPASATLRIVPQSEDRFLMTGSDRTTGESAADNFELVITRRPAPAGDGE